MPVNPTPRQILAGLLQGALPSRPLLLPIVFSLGAKIENLARRDFLSNPTKISNSLRQIRTHLRSDGVACYFDPFLEIEALGASLGWRDGGHPPKITWPHPTAKGALPSGLRSPDDAAKHPRVKVAVEVLTRLKSLFRDEPLLMAGVTGPLTLAARLTQLDQSGPLQAEELPAAALEIAASAITAISSAFVAAGANVLFLQEEILPALTTETCQSWASSLAPTFNIIRFYEALPVLQLSGNDSLAQNATVIFEQSWDCILCLPLAEIVNRTTRKIPASSSTLFGIALPPESFVPSDEDEARIADSFAYVIAESKPALLSTTADVPITTDLKRLMKIMEDFSRTA
jgi:Uroporphyrinogen decarboxylase (URO-D)